MNRVKVELKLINAIEKGQKGSKTSNVSLNNVSNAIDVVTQKNQGFKAGCFGGLTLGEPANLISDYNGLSFKTLVDSNNETTPDLVLTVNAEVGYPLSNLTIYFDNIAKQWATECIITGTNTSSESIEPITKYSDDYIWAFIFPENLTQVVFTFKKWHRINYCPCITYIAIELYNLTFDDFWIKSLESISQITADNSSINYGVLPNAGDLELFDRNGELYDYAQEGFFDESNIPITVFINDKQVQAHISVDANYDYEGKTLIMELSNKLDLYNNSFSPLIRTYTKTPYIELIEILAQIMGYNVANADFLEMLNKDIIVNNGANKTTMTVQSYLQAITSVYGYLPGIKLREAIDNVCNIAQLSAIELDDGKTKFLSARPLATMAEIDNAIKIPARMQFANFVPTVILRNRFNEVEIPFNNAIQELNEILGLTYEGYRQGASSPTEIEDPEKVKYSYIKTDFDFTASNQFGFGHTFYLEFETNINLSNLMLDIFGTNNKVSSKFYDYIRLNSTANENYLGQLSYDNFATINNSWNRNTKRNFLTQSEANASTVGQYVMVLVQNKAEFDNMSNNWNNLDNKPHFCTVAINENIINNKLTVYFRVPYYRTRKFGATARYRDYFLNNNITLNTFFLEKENEVYFKQLGDKTFALPQTQLLHNSTKFGGNPIYELIAENILEDYQNGIVTATTTVVCGDYFKLDGTTKALNWENNSEIFQVGDIVRVDKDNEGNSASKDSNGSDRLFRITGRKFRYEGVPEIDLELQEVKGV